MRFDVAQFLSGEAVAAHSCGCNPQINPKIMYLSREAVPAIDRRVAVTASRLIIVFGRNSAGYTRSYVLSSLRDYKSAISKFTRRVTFPELTS